MIKKDKFKVALRILKYSTFYELLSKNDSSTTQFTHGAEPFLRSHQFCNYSRIFQPFVEPEGSFLCSQEPSTGPYPEPDKSNPYHPISLGYILILSAHLHLGLPSSLFPSGSPISYMHSSPPPFVLHALPT
jgi:hypothetical protein